MKRVDEMSIGEMERYFARIDRVKKAIGRGYRLVWPFPVLTPFSPARFLLNLGVILTWVHCIRALLSTPTLQEFAVPLARMWATVLCLTLITAALERHVRITSRYRSLMRQHRSGWFPRAATPTTGHGSRSGRNPEDLSIIAEPVAPAVRKDGARPRGSAGSRDPSPGQGSPSQEESRKVSAAPAGKVDDRNVVEIGIDIIKKLFG